MIALPKSRSGAEVALTPRETRDWLLTERQAREAAATMEPALAQRADRAQPRRFTGEPITGFGELL